MTHRSALKRAALAAALTSTLIACTSGAGDGAGDPPPTSAPVPTTAPFPTTTGSTQASALDPATSTPSSPDPTTTTTPGTAADAPQETAPTSTSTSTEEGSYESPLDEYIGGSVSAAGFDAEEYQRLNQLNEEAIARCMKAQGFDYIPYSPVPQWSPVVTPGGASVISLGGGIGAGLSDEEFAKQYGYGISTNDRPAGETEEVNPNGAIVDALSVSGRVAYYQALYGPDVSLQDDGHLAHKELPHDPSSCWRQASDETFGEQPVIDTSTLDAFAPLIEEIGSLAERALADPRMVAALQDWSTCLADHGFPGYDDLNKPRQDVSDRAVGVLGSAMDPTTADPQELAEVRAFEISLATADWECHQAWDATYLAVTLEIETAFVENNRAQLERYRDAIAASTAAAGESDGEG